MERSFPYASRRRFDRTEGVNDAFTVKVNGIGKGNIGSHFVIANEWISACLGTFLRLPIAPFSIMGKNDPRTKMFVSVSFEGDSTPKHAIPDRLASQHPNLATGIIVFDVLIANNDRHSRNLKVDHPQRPKRVYVFDHDRSLFFIEPQRGVERLRTLENALGISAGALSGGNRHCLIDSIKTSAHFPGWLARVQDIPDWFIESICDEAADTGLTIDETAEAKTFLKYRRDHIGELISQHKTDFTAIRTWPLFL
ncbi:MAG: hypothetical protein K8T25_20600 [Planctomycetia bacterium]|nr:hypothetical protein [Planctomycetia bacterium]